MAVVVVVVGTSLPPHQSKPVIPVCLALIKITRHNKKPARLILMFLWCEPVVWWVVVVGGGRR